LVKSGAALRIRSPGYSEEGRRGNTEILPGALMAISSSNTDTEAPVTPVGSATPPSRRSHVCGQGRHGAFVSRHPEKRHARANDRAMSGRFRRLAVARSGRAAAGDELKLHTECAARLGDELAKVEKAKASRYLCRNPMPR